MNTSEQEARSCSLAISSSDWVGVLRCRALKGQERLHQSERAISRLACQSTSLQLCLDSNDGHKSAPAMLQGLSARCASCSCRAFPSTPQQQERSRLGSNTPGNNNSVALMAAKLGLDSNTTTSTSCVWTSALQTPCRDGHCPSNDTLSCEDTVKDEAQMTRSSSNEILLIPTQEHETNNLTVLNGETRGSTVSGVAVAGRCLLIGKQGSSSSYREVDSISSCHRTIRTADSRNHSVSVFDNGDENCSKQSAGQSSVLSHSNSLDVQNSLYNLSVAEHHKVSSFSKSFGKTSPHSKLSLSSPLKGLSHKLNPNISHSSAISDQRMSTKAKSRALPTYEVFELVPKTDVCSGSFNGNSTQTDGSCGSSAHPASCSEFLGTSPSQCQRSTSPKFRSKPKSRTLRNKVLARNLFTSEGPKFKHEVPSPAHSAVASPPQLSSFPQLMVPTSCSVADLIKNAIVHPEETDVAQSRDRSSSDQQCRLGKSTTMDTSESKHILENSCEDPNSFLVRENISRNSSNASSTVIDDKISLKDETRHSEQHSTANHIRLNNGTCLQQNIHCNASEKQVQLLTPPSTNKLSSPSKSPTFQTKTPQGQTRLLRFSTSTPLVYDSRVVSKIHRGLLNSTCAPALSNSPTSSANPVQVPSHPCTPVKSAEPVDFFHTDVPPTNASLSSTSAKPASSTSINSRRPDPDVRATNDECSQLSKSHSGGPAETFVPPVALTYTEYYVESRTNPIDILCSPVKNSMKPKFEHLNLPKGILEPDSGMYQTSNNGSNPLANVELENHEESLGSPPDTTFKKTSDTLSYDYPPQVQKQTSQEAKINLTISVDELNYFRPEPTDSLKSECRKVLDTEGMEAVTDDSSRHGKSFIDMNRTPVLTTPRVTKLSLHGLKKLEMLKKKQTPLRNFLYPTSCDEPNRKAANLNYTDNIEDSIKFSGFIEADITTRLPPVSSKWKDVQNHSAETNMNKNKTNSGNKNTLPSMDLAANTQISQLDFLKCKQSSSKVSHCHGKDISKSERNEGMISGVSERDNTVAPFAIADSIQAWQQSSISQDLENFLMDMSTQKMICFDENASNDLTEDIPTSGDCKDIGQSIKLPMTATAAGNASPTNINERKSTENSIIDNSLLKYLRSSPSGISRNENSAKEIENGDINGIDKSKGMSGSSFTTEDGAQTSGSAPFAGFSTAGGKHIAVDDEALKKAKTIWSKCDEDNSHNVQPNRTQTKNILDTSLTGDVNTDKWTTKPRVGDKAIVMENDSSNSTSTGSLRSAKEAVMRVVDIASENSKLLSEEAGMDMSSATLSASRAAGFTTARGNVIPVNKESLRRASRFWSECGENCENPPEISSLSNLQTENVFPRKCVDNEQAYTRFADFAAKGTSSEKSLEKARQVLTDDEKIEDSNPSSAASKGFITAEGVLREANQLLAERNASEERSSEPTVNLGFTTAKGSIIKVGEEALKKAKFLLTESESAENIDFGSVSSSVAAKKSLIAEKEETQSPLPLLGFKTANGSVIEVRQDALEKAKRLWNDSGQTEESADLGFQIPKVSAHNSKEEMIDNPTKRRRIMNDNPKSLGNQESSSDFQTSKGFSGFKTANGSVLKVDPDAVRKAKALWVSSNDSDSVVPSNRLDQIRPVDVPHPLVKVVQLPSGKTPKRGFIKHKVDTSKISGESGRLPEPASYKGSPSADIGGRVYPKNVGRNETTRSSWSVPTRTTPTVSNCKPMLDKLTEEEQEMLNAQLSSIAEEFLQDEDWNIEGQSIKTTGCVQKGITSKATDLGSKSGEKSITAIVEKNMPLNETSLSVNISRNATPAQECSATAGTIDKQAENVQLGEENVDPKSWLMKTEDSQSYLKVATGLEPVRSSCDTSLETNTIETISGRSPNDVIEHVPPNVGTGADICDVKKDFAAELFESQNTGGKTATSCTATASSISSTVTITTRHDHCKSGSMIFVPTPNNFTTFESAHRTPTKGPDKSLEAAVSPVLLRSRQIKSKIQLLREQYGTPKPLPLLQASPVVLKIPFKTPLRPQAGE